MLLRVRRLRALIHGGKEGRKERKRERKKER